MKVIETQKCPVCHKSSEVHLKTGEYEALKAGVLIQDALPERDADFRELLITGTHAKCWDSLMSDDG